MAGNRKYGFRKGAGHHFTYSPWFCDGCQKTHPVSITNNETLEGLHLCDRKYVAHANQRAARLKLEREAGSYQMPTTSTKLRRPTRAQKTAEQFHQANYIRVFGEHFPAKGGTIADTSTLGGLFDETPHARATKQPKPAQYDLFADTKEG